MAILITIRTTAIRSKGKHVRQLVKDDNHNNPALAESQLPVGIERVRLIPNTLAAKKMVGMVYIWDMRYKRYNCNAAIKLFLQACSKQ